MHNCIRYRRSLEIERKGSVFASVAHALHRRARGLSFVLNTLSLFVINYIYLIQWRNDLLLAISSCHFYSIDQTQNPESSLHFHNTMCWYSKTTFIFSLTILASLSLFTICRSAESEIGMPFLSFFFLSPVYHHECVNVFTLKLNGISFFKFLFLI